MPPRFSPSLLTDLYELTMAQAYFEEGLSDVAVFSLFVRQLPERRNYLVACGLDAVLGFLETLRFDRDAIGYLERHGGFSSRFLAYLERLRFTGEVDAVPEGTPVFANEPILEIAAPIVEAQLVETFVMNQIHCATTLASKAARVVAAAQGRPVVDFGFRRMHGVDAALIGARAFHIVGVASTSNVAAGQVYGLATAGTMAHSYVQAHAAELDAFRAFARLSPRTVLLVDTYDTIGGIRNVIRLAAEQGPSFQVSAVRLDSGDLLDLSVRARRMLDGAGLRSVGIFASGGLDEYEIERLLTHGAPVTGFGVGTEMGTSRDAPGLDIVYKLVEYGGHGCLKLSPGKELLPGPKQVFRVESDGGADHDVLGLRDELLPGRPLLRPVMRAGQRLREGQVSLGQSRQWALAELQRLPPGVRALGPANPPYRIDVSAALVRSTERLRQMHRPSSPRM